MTSLPGIDEEGALRIKATALELVDVKKVEDEEKAVENARLAAEAAKEAEAARLAAAEGESAESESGEGETAEPEAEPAPAEGEA